MPVDQTGEDILFIAQDSRVEVHIRIQYEGEAENFAWVIPVQTVPTDFRVGSDQFFENIKNGSVPTYGFQVQPDDCSLPSPEDDNAGDPGATAGAGGTGGSDGDTDGGGPTIYAQETVGAFEITVLGDGTVDEVMQWLADNGYQQDPNAEPILAEYLAEDHKFAAIKLVGGADVDELHPIALTFDHPEPCVPLRLTRIAATDDMDVRTYFLGDARMVPMNYRHVLVNPLKIDWINQAANYKDVITKAVDAEHADGRAFVTEYAGSSEVVPQFGLLEPSWDDSVFTEASPVEVPSLLMNQGLLACGYDWNTDTETCAGVHPMVDPLLANYLPVPEGVDPYLFYSDTAAYEGLIDLEVWDGPAFAQTMRERIIEPGEHAVALLNQYPYLTRMYTTISPHEMLEDPMFHQNADLEDVANIRTATQRILCSGDNVWTLPDGREVFVPAGGQWPDIGGDEYWEEVIQETPSKGAAMVLVDNTEAIDDQLAAYNAEQGWDGAPDVGGTDGSGSGDSDGTGQDGDGDGCGCQVDAPAGGWGALAFMVGFGLITRRRRR